MCRQFMAPDVCPVKPGESQRATTMHAVLLAAIIAGPIWMAVLL